VTQKYALLRLAGPIILAQLLQCLNSLVDTVMAGQHSPVTLSQVAMGASFWIPLLVFASGLFSGLSSLSAEAFGARASKVSQKLLCAGLVSAFILSFVVLFLLFNVGMILPLFKVPIDLANGIVDYVCMVAIGFPGLLVFAALRGWVEGLHRTSLAMIAAALSVALNVPLNYIFIFGWGIIPELGAKGAGIATALASYVYPLAMLWLFRRDHQVMSLIPSWRGLWRQFDLTTLKRVFTIGLPLGFAGFVEASFFCVIAVMLAPLGAISVAAHQITLNISSMMFMVPLGLNFAITVAVGRAIGEGQSALQVRRIISTGLRYALIFALASCTFIVMLNHKIPLLYTSDDHVIALASGLLLWAGLFQIADGLQVVMFGALKGLQDTLVPLIITLCAYWLLGASLGYSMTFFESFGAFGAKGAWIGLNIGLGFALIGFSWRLKVVFNRRFTPY